MNSAIPLCCHDDSVEKNILQEIAPAFISKFYVKNERKILKIFLLVCFRKLFFELSQDETQCSQDHSLMECYVVDGKIIQFVIQGIIETGEYTLEGIAYYTHIPLEVLYEAAYSIGKQFTITFWAKLVELYIQVRPDIVEILIDKLLEIKEKKCIIASLLRNHKEDCFF